MATKPKYTKSEEKQTVETWRKPLQVPPRADAMRSFYKGAKEEDETDESANKVVQEKQPEAAETKNEKYNKIETKSVAQPVPNKKGREAVAVKPRNEQPPPNEKSEEAFDSSLAGATATKSTDIANNLTKQEISEKLGIEIEDLFDVHELLRGKSFDIYQTLMQSADEAGRCKITQPELMKRTGIKNRRTFYKHEEWLIKLKLLEKRHLPGDHKGVVYRVLEISDVLPLSNELLAKFKRRLENIE